MRRNKPFRLSLTVCARVFVCCKGWAGEGWPEEEEKEEEEEEEKEFLLLRVGGVSVKGRERLV